MSNKIKLFEGNYAQKILSYYLWGQENPPEATASVGWATCCPRIIKTHLNKLHFYK